MKKTTLTTTAQAIRDSFPEFLDALARSTAMAPWAHEMRCKLDPRSNRQRVEDAVREVFRALPPNWSERELTGTVLLRIQCDLPVFGLLKAPCEKVVREYVRAVVAEKKRHFGTEMPHGSTDARYSASMQFTSTLQST